MSGKNIYQQAAVERRRAKGYVKSLEKARKQLKGTGRRAVSKKIREVRKAVERSYRGSGYSVEKATRELRKLVGESRAGTRARVNRVFQQQIGLASRGEKSSLGGGEIGRFKSKAFYRATQRLWEGAPPEQRNKIIMEKFGVRTLGEAFDVVMSDKSVQMAVGRFEDALKLGVDFESAVEEYTSSPPELALVELMKMK